MLLGNGMYVETTCHCMLKQSRSNVPFHIHFPPFKGLKQENSTTEPAMEEAWCLDHAWS